VLLSQFVESSLVMQLENANKIALHRATCHDEITDYMCRKKRFAVVNMIDFELQGSMLTSEARLADFFLSSDQVNWWNESIHTGGRYLGVDATMRKNLVVRMAFQAGIVKMDYYMRKYLWSLLIKTIYGLMKPVCESVLVDERPYAWSCISSDYPLWQRKQWPSEAEKQNDRQSERSYRFHSLARTYVVHFVGCSQSITQCHFILWKWQ
jgi:hypothetical protein